MSETIAIPECCLLLLVGASGSGKTTFAQAKFTATEVLSSDHYREVVADDADSGEASTDAFAAIRLLAAARLKRRLLAVVDATNLRPENRAEMVELARQNYANAIAIVFDVPLDICLERNRQRTDRQPRRVVERHVRQTQSAIKGARREGFAHVFKLDETAATTTSIERQKLWTDKRDEHGPFDLIGDVHGCLDELLALVDKLGYVVTPHVAEGMTRYHVRHPDGRRLVGLGDYGDRGPNTPGVLAFWMDAVAAGAALCVKGNHDLKLLRHLRRGKVNPNHGFDRTMAQFATVPVGFAEDVRQFLDGLLSHLWLDGGALVAVHAGIRAEMIGRAGKLVSEFCLFGDSTGETDEYGLPIRQNWALSYHGHPAVVYGHVPTVAPEWVNNTFCADTGCVFGGALTALRWPERAVVSVPAAEVYYPPVRPLAPPPARLNWPDSAALTSKTAIQTRYREKPVIISAERAAAAFDLLARVTVDPRWLITLAPTTATVEASVVEGWLERPEEAFAHYARGGLSTVVVQEKHMGSRATVIVCRHDGSRFNDPARAGVVISKGGRPFFDDPADEMRLVDAVRAAMTDAGLWDDLNTDWVVLDGEILPWDAKAARLIREVFAATSAAGLESLRWRSVAFSQAALRGVPEAAAVTEEADGLRTAVLRYRAAYRHFVTGYREPEDLRFAPFHVLAAEGQVFDTMSHAWHMQQADRLAAAHPRIIRTQWHELALHDPAACAATVAFWEKLTAEWDEGIVVKGPHLASLPGLAPSIKVRGREYLRIIYGPDYDFPSVLPRLKNRATGRKRQLAQTGTMLALESLHRFVAKADMAQVHAVVAAALALATEPLDSRL